MRRLEKKFSLEKRNTDRANSVMVRTRCVPASIRASTSFHSGHGTKPSNERAVHSFMPRDKDFGKSRVGGRTGRRAIGEDRRDRNSGSRPKAAIPLPRLATSATRLGSRHRSGSGIKPPKTRRSLDARTMTPRHRSSVAAGNVAVIPSEALAQAASECESPHWLRTGRGRLHMRAHTRARESSAMFPMRATRESIPNHRAGTSLCSDLIVISPTMLRLQNRTDGSGSN